MQKDFDLSDRYESHWTCSDGNGQKQGETSCMADTGENTFPCEYFRRQCRNVAGMYLFHHKTKHWYFVVGMPAILILQICIAVLIWKTHGFGM